MNPPTDLVPSSPSGVSAHDHHQCASTVFIPDTLPRGQGCTSPHVAASDDQLSSDGMPATPPLTFADAETQFSPRPDPDMVDAPLHAHAETQCSPSSDPDMVDAPLHAHASELALTPLHMRLRRAHLTWEADMQMLQLGVSPAG